MFSSKSFQSTSSVGSVGNDVRQGGSTRTASSEPMARRTLLRYITNIFFSTERLSITTLTQTSSPILRCDAKGLATVSERGLLDDFHLAEVELKASLTSRTLPYATDSEGTPATALPTGETNAYIDRLALDEEQARLQEVWTDFAPTPAAHIPSADSLAYGELLAIQEEATDIDTRLVDFAVEHESPAPALPLSQAELMLDNPVPILVDYGMDAHGPIDGKVVLKGADALRAAYEACRAETCLVKGVDATVDDGELAFQDTLPTPADGQQKAGWKCRRFDAGVKTLFFVPRR